MQTKPPARKACQQSRIQLLRQTSNHT
jgi:hypothetical protein